MNELDHDLLVAIIGGVRPTCTFDPETFVLDCRGDTRPY